MDAPQLLGVDSGLNPKNVLTMGISVPQGEIYVGPPAMPRFCQDLDERAAPVKKALVGSLAGPAGLECRNHGRDDP
ncbi:MAG: hypothetical protein WAM39_27635 [Bryobacteraceae bacterium]